MEWKKERIGNKRKILISIIHKAVLQSPFFLSADWCLMKIEALLSAGLQQGKCCVVEIGLR